MATVSEPSVEQINRDAARIEAETRKLRAEAAKLAAEEYKLSAERAKRAADARFSPWLFVVQCTLAAAAIMGAGAGLAKLFLS